MDVGLTRDWVKTLGATVALAAMACTPGQEGEQNDASAGNTSDDVPTMATSVTGDPTPNPTTDQSSAEGTTGGTTDQATTEDPDSSDDGFIFDVNETPDGGGGGCGGGEVGDLSFSYIWIANSGEGTISKIDTQTLDEVGRFLVSPNPNGLPSRTSVNLSGDVAVANRTGGITKVYADQGDCQESNGMAGIQTSTGASDILAWGTEECVAWHSPFAYGSQRPIAWTQGTFNPGTCSWQGQQVWTTGTNVGGTADVILLNGDDGSIDDMVTINGLTAFNDFGGYGAVVDTEGNLWFNEMHIFGDFLVRVDIDDLSYDLIPTTGRSGYGIAIDDEERIWTCGGGAVNRYDHGTGTWASYNLPLDLGGCMVDGEDRLWVSGSNAAPFTFRAINTNSVTEVASFTIPEHVHGVSIDFEGNIWGVAGVPGVGAGTAAYRMDPTTGTYDTVTGLVDAYTYSDMTGFALVGSTPPQG